MKQFKAPQITLQEMRLIARCRKSMEAAFNGGVNCYGLPTEINANQCSDSLNMWYRKQLVRTRPGMVATSVADSSKNATNTALLNKVRVVTNFYVPTIYTNCNSRGGGNQNEDRNILTPKVKMEFSPGGGDKSFKLADKGIDNADVVISYQAPSESAPTSYTINDADTSADSSGRRVYTFTNAGGNTYTITLDRVQGLILWNYISGGLTTTDKDGKVIPMTTANWTGFTDDATYNVENNLIITYSKTIPAYAANPITLCTLAQYFGGSLSGLGNGDCLIVSGNSLEPNKFWWSAMDDITYWPANNFNSCGDTTDSITAMAKQLNELIIFKKKSVYAVTYNATQPTSTTVPYEPFPQRLLHSGLGCDCPDTVELVQNYLTWLNSDGTVYRIVSTANKDQNCIVPLSQNISPLLKAIPTYTMQVATACHSDSYYIVFCGTQAFAWDYGDAPFVNSADSNTAQLRLSWYPWTFPTPITNAFCVDDVISLNAGVFTLIESVGVDYGVVWFNAYVVSKDYDFSIPFEYKQVIDEWFTLSGDEGMSLTVEIKDDLGAIDYVETLAGASTTTITFKLNVQSQWTKHFQVAVRRVSSDYNKFGIDKVVLTADLGRDIGEN